MPRTLPQVETMEHLSQASAAWLCGLSPRTLRDAADLQRAADGSYSGRDVLAWFAGRIGRPELTDDEWERLTIVAELITPERDAYLCAMMDAIDGLREAHGEAVLLTLLDQVLATSREQVEGYRRWEADPKMQHKARARRGATSASRRRGRPSPA